MSLDPSNPRDVLVAAGRDRLVTRGVEALRSRLNASVLSAVTPVSRDTAYRSFRTGQRHATVSDAVVAAVSEATHDPAWMGYQDTIRATLADHIDGLGDRDDTIAAVKAALQANYEVQFRSPSTPAAWLLLAAAFTGSPAWKGEPPPSDCADLAAELLEHGRASYANMTRHLVNTFSLVMSAVGRRPCRDVPPETVVMLLHALHDGAVLRGFVDPGALAPELVAEALYRLAEAFTEEGAFTDPRRPDDERSQRIFDDLLDGAADLWRRQPEVTVDQAADRAGVPPEAAILLFPTAGDMADSLIRSRVVGGGFADLGPYPDDVEVGERLLTLITELRNLRAFADELPFAVEVTRTSPPTRSSSFVDDFVDNESPVVVALDAVPDPARFVRDLVTFASQGTPGWSTVDALLRSIGHDPDR